MGIDSWSAISSDSAGAGYVFVPGGIFAASREAVRHTPLAIYRNLEAEMSRGANLEAGHYMERSWMQAFGAADARRDFSNVRGSMVIYTVLTRAQAATYHAHYMRTSCIKGMVDHMGCQPQPPRAAGGGGAGPPKRWQGGRRPAERRPPSPLHGPHATTPPLPTR